MQLNVGKEVVALQRMTVKELRSKYAEVFGDETRTGNKTWLVKRIAWRMQAVAEGDLSERARQRADELANDADLRMSPPKSKPVAPTPPERTTTTTIRVTGDDRLPLPGTIITREYKGQSLQVRVLPNGFEYEGELKLVQRTRCTRWFTENAERFASRCFLFLCPFSRCFRRAARSHPCLCFEPAHSGSERNPPRLHSHPEYLSPKLSLSLVNTTLGLTESC